MDVKATDAEFEPVVFYKTVKNGLDGRNSGAGTADNLAPSLRLAGNLHVRQSATEVIATIYELLKADNPQLTLGRLARRIGLKGSNSDKLRKIMGDVIAGRRKLPLRCVAPLCIAAKLSPLERLSVTALIEADQTRSKKRRQERLATFSALLTALPAKKQHFVHDVALRSFAYNVHAAFGTANLEGRGVALADLTGFFGRSRIKEIEQALQYLQSMGYIRKDKERYLLMSPQIVENSAFAQARFQEVGRNLERWYNDPESAVVGATTVAIRRVDYQLMLDEFRRFCLNLVAANRRKEGADMLAEIAISVTPLFQSSPQSTLST